MSRTFLSLAMLLSAALSACGDDGATAGIDAAGGGCPAICNTLALPAVVMKTANPAARPPFTGGTIADGTYAVTSVVDYGTTMPGGVTVQEIYRFTGTTIETAVASSEAAEMHFCGTFSTAANIITFDVTCPQTRSIDLEYTATANTFVFQHGSNMNEVASATKQ